MQLSIVIHTEEEFDWNAGFYRSKNSVTHGKELIEFCQQMINVGGKVTLAMDYAFVTSVQGKKVVDHFKAQQNAAIEFASHLHPWVNPPFDEQSDKIDEFHSYPGNLPKEIEFQKLENLTAAIENLTGQMPTTYLAGRYGIGKNTNEILIRLGYKTDISVSPFTDYTNQLGPNFNHHNNDISYVKGIKNWPHTTGVVSKIPRLTKYVNNNPSYYAKSFQNPLTKLVNKVARVQRQRLSPEGFSLNEMKKLTLSQIKLGKTDFILSFHSPSVKVGLTPYVQNQQQLSQFEQDTIEYIRWFQNRIKGTCVLVNQNDIKEHK